MDKSLNKIAVLGNWSEKNYGSEITYYALYHVIKSMGYEVTLFERPREAAWGPNESPVLFRDNPYDNSDLVIFDTKIEMRNLNNKFNTFLIGSDQMWHHDLKDCFGNICYFDFIDDTKKKIAYATSFGTNEWNGTEEEIENASLCLKAFDHISVRERSGQKICKECFGVKAECVLDPVFLCDINVFSDLAEKSGMDVPKKYIGVYILDIDNSKDILLKHAESYLGMEANIISDAFKNNLEKEWEEQKRDIHLGVYIEDWLKNIISSDYVITDSFHGMCFAIMFKKQFIVYANPGRGVARFIDLLEELELQERLVDHYQKDKVQNLLESKIDYHKVDNILELRRKKSYNWLASALADVKYTKSEKYDFIKKKIYDLEYESYLRWKEQQIRLDSCECGIRNNSEVLNRHEEVVIRHEEVMNRHEEVVNRHEEVVNRHEEVVDRHEEVVGRHEEVINRHEEVVNRHEEALNRHEGVVNRHEEVVDRHEEVINRHEEVVNRHEEVINRHEEVVNRHEEALNRHEEVVNRHEGVVNRHEEVVNRHEEVMNRHEEVVNRHEEAVNRHEEVVNRHEEAINYQWEEQKALYARVNELDEKFIFLRENYEKTQRSIVQKMKLIIGDLLKK